MRIALTDGSGKWFSDETAEFFKEDTYWDGHNWISKATGWSVTIQTTVQN